MGLGLVLGSLVWSSFLFFVDLGDWELILLAAHCASCIVHQCLR